MRFPAPSPRRGPLGGSPLLLALGLLAASTALAEKDPPPQLVITAAHAELDGAPCLLLLRGRNFGERPLEVRLAEEPLLVLDHGDEWARA